MSRHPESGELLKKLEAAIAIEPMNKAEQRRLDAARQRQEIERQRQLEQERRNELETMATSPSVEFGIK